MAASPPSTTPAIRRARDVGAGTLLPRPRDRLARAKRSFPPTLRTRTLRTSSKHRATRLQPRALACAMRSPKRRRWRRRSRRGSGSIRTRDPLSCPNQAYILALFTGHIASQTRVLELACLQAIPAVFECSEHLSENRGVLGSSPGLAIIWAETRMTQDFLVVGSLTTRTFAPRVEIVVSLVRGFGRDLAWLLAIWPAGRAANATVRRADRPPSPFGLLFLEAR
jgi:hypothetical protein